MVIPSANLNAETLLADSDKNEIDSSFDPRTIIWPEIFIPGYGAFMHDRPITGGLLIAGRLLSIYLYTQFSVEYLEYRSAEKSARLADFFLGPGLRYPDPYAGGFKNSSEFQREADRRISYQNSALVLQASLMAAGLYLSHRFRNEYRGSLYPVFELENEHSGFQFIDENIGEQQWKHFRAGLRFTYTF